MQISCQGMMAAEDGADHGREIASMACSNIRCEFFHAPFAAGEMRTWQIIWAPEMRRKRARTRLVH